MSKISKKTLTLLGTTLLFALTVKNANASEGYFELRNTKSEAARCYASSVLMGDLNHHILVSCRDIIYPGGTEIYNYVVWVRGIDGKNTRLGELNLGKVEFKTKVAFTSMFVTKERNSKPKSPEGEVIMQGSLQNFALLENPKQQPSPSITSNNELGKPETPAPTQTSKPSIAKNLGNIFRIGGTIAFIVLFITILLVIVITRR